MTVKQNDPISAITTKSFPQSINANKAPTPPMGSRRQNRLGLNKASYNSQHE